MNRVAGPVAAGDESPRVPHALAAAGDPERGALVLSLDFELRWGIRDHCPRGSPYIRNLLGVWNAVPRMLALFREFEIACTWATVGLLFAPSRAEQERYSPSIRPRYANPLLDPYQEEVGDGEADDPLHFAPSLIRQVRETVGQEIATHTYSHYYCLEEGQDREAFRADLQSALRIARDGGIDIRSIVFPRNQWNPEYADVLLEAGIDCYRGNRAGWGNEAVGGGADKTRARRAARLSGAYLPFGDPAPVRWRELVQPSGLVDVRASTFLRPFSPRLEVLEPFRERRLHAGLRRAAQERGIFHLWWHPHNFGAHTDENLRVLRRILEEFSRLRDAQGMQSLSMHQAALTARGIRHE